MADSTLLLERIDTAITTAENLIEMVAGEKVDAGNVLHKTGTETITGEKTFTLSPHVPTPVLDDKTDRAANMAIVSKVKETADKGVADAAKAQEKADAALPKTGGEISGAVRITEGRNPLRFPCPQWDISQNPSSRQSVNIAIADKNNINMANWGYTYEISGNSFTGLYAFNVKEDGSSFSGDLGVCACKDGTTFATGPHPRESNYGTDLDTVYAAINRHPIKKFTLTLHLDENTGSDTADLYKGRGLSEEMPFKTLQAALSHGTMNYTWGDLFIILHSDITAPNVITMIANCQHKVKITSDTTKRTLNFKGINNYGGGGLLLENIKLVANDSVIALQADGSVNTSHILINNDVEIAGKVSNATLVAMNGGSISIHGAITGNVTGKRYSVTNGGRILTGGKGPEAIPGSQAGTCDASSIYA